MSCLSWLKLIFFQIQAVVYLADGQQCRCIQVDANGTVQDLIEHMLEACLTLLTAVQVNDALQVQEEWEEIGQDGPKPITFKSSMACHRHS